MKMIKIKSCCALMIAGFLIAGSFPVSLYSDETPNSLGTETETSAPQNGTTSTGGSEQSEPSEQTTPPAQQNGTPAQQNGTSSSETPKLSEPSEQTTPPAQQNGAPAQQNGTSSSETPELSEPSEQTTPPAQQNGTPAQQNGTSSSGDPELSEQSEPSAQTTPPAQQNGTPAQLNGAPAQQNGTPKQAKASKTQPKAPSTEDPEQTAPSAQAGAPEQNGAPAQWIEAPDTYEKDGGNNSNANRAAGNPGQKDERDGENIVNRKETNTDLNTKPDLPGHSDPGNQDVDPSTLFDCDHVNTRTSYENAHHPTCSSEGSIDYVTYCSDCDQEIDRVTVQLEPSDSFHMAIRTIPYTAPTCDESGNIEYYVCNDCGNWFLNDFVKVLSPDDVILNPTDHSWDEWHVSQHADCTTPGKMTRKCLNDSSHEETKEIPAGHTPKDRSEVVPATCDKDGGEYIVVYCNVCNNELSRTLTKPLPKTGHVQGRPVQEKRVEAHFTQEGSYESVVYCEVCRAELSRVKETIPAPVKMYEENNQKPMRDLPHHQQKAPPVNTPESTDWEITKKPTCTENGVRTRWYNGEIQEDVIYATGHAWGDWKTTREATSLYDGEETRICGNNQNHVETRSIAARRDSQSLQEPLIFVNNNNSYIDPEDDKEKATRTYYVSWSSEVSITVILSDPAQVPDTAEVVVTAVTQDADSFLYDASMKALNSNSEYADYTTENTLLYDIKFVDTVMDENGEMQKIEYEPAKGTVRVIMRFNQNQLSNEINAEDSENVEVNHLVAEEEEDTEPNDIAAEDIEVKPVEADVKLEGTNTVTFVTESFSVYAFSNIAAASCEDARGNT